MKIADSIESSIANDSTLLIGFQKNGYRAAGLFDWETMSLKSAVMDVSLDGAILINDLLFVWRQDAHFTNHIYLESYKVNTPK